MLDEIGDYSDYDHGRADNQLPEGAEKPAQEGSGADFHTVGVGFADPFFPDESADESAESGKKQ